MAVKKISHTGTLAIFVFSLSLIFPLSSEAASYDAYVDAGYSGDEEGSEEKPFDTISEAIESGAEKIFIKKGKYDEKVSLKKSVRLYGKDKASVIIKGSVLMKDDTFLNDITVEDEITVEENADAGIENCAVKNFKSIGINAAPGNGKISVLSSKIYGGGGKGMYIQAGKEVEISGNEIYDNSEEGIDVRAKVSGSISKNLIYNNGESGIEIIAGSSDVVISANTIKKNHASAIAAQFYKENKKTGNISIESNILSKNNKYGIDCAIPSGGGDKMEPDYWKNSLNLNGNTIEGNSLNSINDYCDIISVVEKEEEEKDNKITESEEIEDEIVPDEELDKQEEILKSVISINLEFEKISAQIDGIAIEIDARSDLRKLIVGPDLRKTETLWSKKNELNEEKAKLDDLMNQAKNDQIKDEINSVLSSILKETEKCSVLILKNESGFSFYGWIIKLLYIKNIGREYLPF